MLTMVCRTCYKQNNSKKNIIIIYFKNRNTKLKNILYVGLEMTPCVTVGSNEMIWTVNVQLDSHSNNIIQYLMVTLFYYILLYFILLYFIIFYYILFYFILLYFVIFCYILLYFIIFYYLYVYYFVFCLLSFICFVLFF